MNPFTPRNFNSLVLLMVFWFVPGANTNVCRFPPSLWFSSKQIAFACGTLASCSRIWEQPQNEAPPVEFALYYESLCEDCKEFNAKQLWPTYQKIGSIMNLTLIPYGNAREYPHGNEWKFICQHGEEECIGNLIEVCAIHLLKKVDIYYPFINCMEQSEQLPRTSAPKCAEKLHINYPPIENCSSGVLGNQLEHQMALWTEKLDPPHTMVPWVTLNGVHTDEVQQEAEDNLLKLICNSYKGAKPAECERKTIRRCHREMSDTVHIYDQL